MMIERFAAGDMSHAMRQVKARMGADAVILSNVRKGNQVEVLAATDYDEALIGELSPPASGSQTEPAATTPWQITDVATIELQQELKSLRNELKAEIAEFHNYRSQGLQQKSKDLALERFREIGLSADIAARLARRINAGDSGKAPGWREVLGVLGSVLNLGTDDLLRQGGIYALVGSTGVGKTTTVAKLATRFAMTHGSDQVALITTDNFRLGGHEQLAAFAEALEVPFAVAGSIEQLADALHQFADRKLVLIDTAGMGQRDLEMASHLMTLGQTSFEIRNLVVLSATSQQGLTQEVIRAFEPAGLSGAVITKVDEAIDMGSVLSGLIGSRLPMQYLCDGQNIPEDLEPASRSGVLKAVVATRQAATGAPATIKETRHNVAN